ncbi:hypothetical protein [Bacillus salipaludis]|uniref:hypothetical protein n=1 Tax=Bacillus salipaludis TaxID=2547811 RepID=UPI002E1A5A3B|nr:hypothetical protein [Bacillus salipaludis]
MMNRATIQNDDGTEEDVLYFRDNHGYLTDKETALKYIEKLRRFYEYQDVEKWIEDSNREQKLENFPIDFNDIYLNKQFKEKVYYYKPFRANLKRDWSFKCDWCGTKVSSKTDKGYFLINSHTRIDHELDGYRACSENCVKLLWKEKFNEYMKNKF